MIRLTINAQSDPQIHLFNKSTILLGAESAGVDLVLPGDDIQQQHLEITEQNGFIVLLNLTNDPDVSINGHPFGKNLLNSGDVITVYETTILFERLDCGAHLQAKLPEEEPLSQRNEEWPSHKDLFQIEQKSDAVFPSIQSFVLPFEKEIEALNNEEWEKFSLESYLKDIENPYWNLEKQKKSEKAIPASTNETVDPADISEQEVDKTLLERKRSKSLKDDYLKELDDDHSHEGKHPFDLGEKSHLWQAWKWIIIFIFSLFAVSGIVVSVLYYAVSDKTEAQETKAAQAVADIAMALTHAQLDHLKPENQNWSDSDFLKSNLQAILPNTLTYASQIDAQGQFNSCPYSLRIYTNTDLSHFLLIAQPAPSLFYWLFPKPIIVVDSHSMELRTVKDVRAINRLLANAEPLEGSNGKEITSLIKEGGLIRLSNLASESGQQDFAPPHNLAWVRPGAENLIYNAPRYYRLGQGVVKKAVNLSTSKGSSQEVTDLKQEVQNMSWLTNLVLYSDQGKKAAQYACQGLKVYAGADKILYGYLALTPQGKIHKAQLLKDEDELIDSVIVNSLKEKEAEVIAFQSSLETRVKHQEREKHQETEAKTEPVALRPAVDDNHPIYIQLQALVVARDNDLRPLVEDLHEMIDQELQTPRPQFQQEYQNLSHAYLLTNARHKRIIKGVLDSLYRQYEDLPMDQFFAFVEDLKLDKLIQKDDQSLTLVDENCKENICTLFEQIERSRHLTELDNLIQIAVSWLTFDYIQDSQELMKYQNMLRNHLLEKLELFLHVPEKHLTVKADDRTTMQHILGQERLIHREERDYFLAEFDELLASQEVPKPVIEVSEDELSDK